MPTINGRQLLVSGACLDLIVIIVIVAIVDILPCKSRLLRFLLTHYHFHYRRFQTRLVKKPFIIIIIIAGVDVAPILMERDLEEIHIPDKDLEITTMRSGGAGGQNVNKVNSAVRIKHLPSGLNVKCTQERSQVMNKDIAMKRLKGQLLAIAKEQRVQEIKEIRGDQVEASWGAQIRNYVLHPYKMVKDQRTNWETANTQSFLDGDLEECIAALLRRRAEEELEAERQETGASM
jgi:hypothetical protein